MHQLMRRVAMALALPLAVGAPVVLLAGPAQAVPPMIALTPNANPSVYGQPIRVVASVFFGEESNPVTDGSIQFVVDGVEQGPPVHLDSTGHATSPALVDEGGLPLDVTVGSDFYAVSADFFPDPSSVYDEVTGQAAYQQRVNEAGTTTAILASPTSIVADVTGRLPGGVQTGAVKPTGPVAFKLNGTPIGTADLVNGQATLNVAAPTGAPRTITATYAGDTDDRYLGSQQSLTRSDPTMTARVLSRLPRSKSGWYRTAVDVWFKCDPAGSELVLDCPQNVRLRESGRGQSVSRTILAQDGGAAAVTVTGIDIDRVKPVITVNGDSCTATDKLSGVRGRCHMKIAPNGLYRAIAHDRAGNRAVVRGVLD
jgi:hypothetical protein